MTDEPAEIFPDDISEKHRRLEKLHKDNVAIENDLVGRQIGVNPWVVLNMRFDLLLNAILDESDRYDFEIESAKKVHDILMEIQRQTANKKPSGLLLPNKAPLQIP